MKTFTSSLIALSLLGIVAPPAGALDDKTLSNRQERSRGLNG